MTIRRSIRFACLPLVVAVALSVRIAAQSSTVMGTITSRDGSPAVNVFVSIANRYRYTDVGGRYKIEGVPQGKQHMVIKRGTKVLWEGDVSISGSAVTLNRVLP